MESVGNEKKIQALFRELKLADELVAPEFISVWNRARATRPESRRIFKLSLALAMVVVVALGSVLLWSQNWQRRQQPGSSVATARATTGATANSTSSSTSSPTRASIATLRPTQLVVDKRVRVKSIPARRLAAIPAVKSRVAVRHQTELNAGNAAVQEAVAISSWQSPTAMLMQSPADDVLTSLPQLDQSLTELKTFLPNTASHQNRER